MLKRSGDKRTRRVAIGIALACAVLVAAAIFALTEQAPDTTLEESSFVNDVLVRLFGDIPGLYDPVAELWLGVHVRHWAHVAEFGVLGLFVALTMLLARWPKPIAPTAAISLAICACCSLFDQCHKLFVPGRHFDWFDLACDALGYCAAVALACAIAAIVMARAKT